MHDAKAVIRFIRANSAKYQLDTEKIVVWGASAGSHIAEMLAATNNQPAFEDIIRVLNIVNDRIEKELETREK